jgi:DNA (cytosine-5)-methyltransferase 1
MDEVTVGGLCSGTGVLEHVVADLVGGRVAWHAQHEPPDKNGREDRWQFASRILAHHWPDIPNLGDITAIDWTQVTRVDWITAGFPCQDVSLAGKREGLVEGTRSGIWRHVAACIAAQRAMRRSGEPGPYVFLENVRGLLSARADSDLEPCPRCMGDRPDQPALRALGRVLGDLANLGFHAEWVGLPASRPDIGACHERFREFILAWPATEDPDGTAGDQRRLSAPGQAEGRRARADAGRRGGAPAADPSGAGLEIGAVQPHGPQRPATQRGGSAAPTDAPSLGRGEGRARSARVVGGPDVALGGGAAPADASGHSGRVGDGNCDAPSDPDGGRLAGHQERDLRQETGLEASCGDDPVGRVLDWGPYGPAIRRWEAVLGRPAPRPTQPGRSAAGQLSAHFVEWHMGLPEGHVTAVPPAPGMSPSALRNAQLKALGGGVVPAQAQYAWRVLMERARQEVGT